MPGKIIVFLLLALFLHAAESEDKLKAVITGKVAKYIQFSETDEKTFVITTYKTPYANLFDQAYDGKKIHSKTVVVKHIDSLDDLGDTDILYLSEADAQTLEEVFEKTKGKKILTISDARGFAERGGMVQYFSHQQKIKIKVNLDRLEENDLKAKASFLNIVEVLKEEK